MNLQKKQGKVAKFSVDTNVKFLKRIDKSIQNQNINNVKTVVSDEDGFSLPIHDCDLIFMRNVFHHITNPESYFKRIKQNLKPGGRIAIVEYSKRIAWSYISGTNHSTPENKICQVMQEAGFQKIEKFNFLDGQSFNIFQIRLE